MMVSTIFPIYFNSLCGERGDLGCQLSGVLGLCHIRLYADRGASGPHAGRGGRYEELQEDRIFRGYGRACSAASCWAFLSSWLWFLGIFVLAKTGYSASLIFYDAMLTDVTEPDRMDSVSSHGYAWGYIGSCIPL